MHWFKKTQTPDFNVHFNDGPVLTNLHKRRSLTARFLLHDRLEYEVSLKPNEWGKCYKRYCAPWKIEILDECGKLITKHEFDPADKNILINFDSRSLGDTLAWIPQVERFTQMHPTTKVFCSHFWSDLGFEPTYPGITFVPPDTTLENIYATFTIGYFLGDDLASMHPIDPRLQPLAKVASDILGIDYEELRPRLAISNTSNDIDEKYVCFSMESTAACKLWQYPGGWDQIVAYLNQNGYRAVLIQKKRVEMDGIINRSGDHPIQQRMGELNSCDFFIGLGSGLSWIAWALDKPVVLISGFSEPYTEFRENCVRVINNDVCTGCWNDPNYVFDRADWNWCPRHCGTDRQFECSRSIAPQMVIDAIQSLTGQTA
ncbi:MAG: autotransporter strand-loop-strand O-heptosyltransferase [Gammaproteobacteria bacterium]|nr:autotransporter strand-loop-strand O-heptosyltransferase [Gammaproteobacteria bacterium]MDH3465458.1 autotransporter strand-loop-strand O-heptosyltransferase [Gammaproteobacteria bacterium]